MDNFLLKDGLEKRAVLYWEKAIQLLERISQFRTEHKSKNTLFEFHRLVFVVIIIFISISINYFLNFFFVLIL